MKQLPLKDGKVALIDDEDFEWANQWKWSLRSRGYVNRTSGKKTIWLHREIMKTPQGFDTDHINGDKLDNRKLNLRICTHSQNLMNQKLNSKNTSGFRGIVWKPKRKKWQVQIKKNQKIYHGGYFKNKLEAVRVYNIKVKELFGEFARLNIIKEKL